jgi:hypothetical protein
VVVHQVDVPGERISEFPGIPALYHTAPWRSKSSAAPTMLPPIWRDTWN